MAAWRACGPRAVGLGGLLFLLSQRACAGSGGAPGISDLKFKKIERRGLSLRAAQSSRRTSHFRFFISSNGVGMFVRADMHRLFNGGLEGLRAEGGWSR